jgi:hypothetical protein
LLETVASYHLQTRSQRTFLIQDQEAGANFPVMVLAWWIGVRTKVCCAYALSLSDWLALRFVEFGRIDRSEWARFIVAGLPAVRPCGRVPALFFTSSRELIKGWNDLYWLLHGCTQYLTTYTVTSLVHLFFFEEISLVSILSRRIGFAFSCLRSEEPRQQESSWIKPGPS